MRLGLGLALGSGLDFGLYDLKVDLKALAGAATSRSSLAPGLEGPRPQLLRVLGKGEGHRALWRWWYRVTRVAGVGLGIGLGLGHTVSLCWRRFSDRAADLLAWVKSWVRVRVRVRIYRVGLLLGS